MTDTTRCPECKGTDVVPIEYVEKRGPGEIELGGPVVTGEWRCEKCGHAWAEGPSDKLNAALLDGMTAFHKGRPRSSADHLPEDLRKAWLEGWESRAERFQGTMDELRWHDNGGDPGAT